MHSICSVNMLIFGDFSILSNRSWTLPFENHKNISRLAMSGDGRTLISVDEGILNVAFVLNKVTFYKPSLAVAKKNGIIFFFCEIEHHFQAKGQACLNESTLLFIADGQCLLINLKRKAVLYHFNFKRPVFDLKFSPNGRYVTLTKTFSQQNYYFESNLLLL